MGVISKEKTGLLVGGLFTASEVHASQSCSRRLTRKACRVTPCLVIQYPKSRKFEHQIDACVVKL